MAEAVGDPYVALAVDVKTAVDDSGPEIFGFARIRGREARHFIAGVRDPDPILLINGQVKWAEERLSPLGVAMMPCISPSFPLKVIPSGGVSGLPFLSNTAIDLPP